MIIILFSILLMFCSVYMFVFPKRWSNGIIIFSEKSYFHIFEIISRFLFGIIFLISYSQNKFPILLISIGSLLIVVSFGLVILGETRHRQFAKWSAIKFQKTFRVASVASFIFAVFLIYSMTDN